VSPLLGGVVGVLALGALFAIGSVLTGIFNTALYRFAANGDAGEVFETAELRNAFRHKK
jgi:hypothetical protein